jgi:hypothetical protein
MAGLRGPGCSAKISRMSDAKPPIVRLNDQIALWDEWHATLPRGGTVDAITHRLQRWSRTEPLEPDLWLFLTGPALGTRAPAAAVFDGTSNDAVRFYSFGHLDLLVCSSAGRSRFASEEFDGRYDQGKSPDVHGTAGATGYRGRHRSLVLPLGRRDGLHQQRNRFQEFIRTDQCACLIHGRLRERDRLYEFIRTHQCVRLVP